MSSPATSTKATLGLTGILLRAALVGLLASWVVGAVVSLLRPGHAGALSFPALVAFTAVRLLAFPLAFAVAYWRLRGRLGKPATPSARLMRAAGVGLLAAGAAYVAGACLGLGSQLQPPPGFTWLVGITAAVASWRRHRAPAPPSALPEASLWGRLVASVLGLGIGLIALFACVFFWQRTPYAWAPWVAGPLAMAVVYRMVVALNRRGLVRSPWDMALGLAGTAIEEGVVLEVADQVLGDD